MNTKGIREYLLVAVKGLCMGAADVIPGVSGGTIAFMTGIYERLVGAINNFDRTALNLLFHGKFKEFWKHIDGTFLVSLILGIMLSIFSLAKLMTMLLNDYPYQTWAFFFGLIVASTIFILKGVKGWKAADVLFTVGGIVLGAVVCTLTPTQTPDGLWFILICGAIAICAMILPGISGSFILLILGKYDYVLGAVAGLTSFSNAEATTASLATGPMTWGQCLCVILVFAVGAAVGIIAFSKFLHWLLSRWNRQTLLVLAGFIIGSLIKVWPWRGNYIIGSKARELPAIPGIEDSLGDVIAVHDAHIAGVVVFALIGFALVSVIEYIAAHLSDKRSDK